MTDIIATATATGTAGVIKAAHAEIVGEANSSCTNVVIFHFDTGEIPVARFPKPVFLPKIHAGYNYHYTHAPGNESVNSSCTIYAGVSLGALAFARSRGDR